MILTRKLTGKFGSWNKLLWNKNKMPGLLFQSFFGLQFTTYSWTSEVSDRKYVTIWPSCTLFIQKKKKKKKRKKRKKNSKCPLEPFLWHLRQISSFLNCYSVSSNWLNCLRTRILGLFVPSVYVLYTHIFGRFAPSGLLLHARIFVASLLQALCFSLTISVALLPRASRCAFAF